METKVTVYETTGEHHERTHDMDPMPSYRELRLILDPLFPDAFWEHVTVLHEGDRRDMFVDESGGTKGLPINIVATGIYQNNALTHGIGDPDNLPKIYGRAVLFGRRVWF